MEARTQLQIMGLVTSFSVSSGCGQTLPYEKQADIIGDFSNSRLKLMQYFLAGITKLQNIKVREAFYKSFEVSLELEKVNITNVVERRYQYITSTTQWHKFTEEKKGELEVSSYNCDSVIDHLRMIYEVQSSEVCEHAFHEKALHFKNWRCLTSSSNSFLCRVVSFFLSSSSCVWKRVNLDTLINDGYSLEAFLWSPYSSSVKTLILNKGVYNGGSCLSIDFSVIPNIFQFQNMGDAKGGLADLFKTKYLRKLEVNMLSLFGSGSLLQPPLRIPETLQKLSLCRGLEVRRITSLSLLLDYNEPDTITEECSSEEAIRKRIASESSNWEVNEAMMVLLLPHIAKLKCLEHLQLTTYNIIDDRHEEYSIPLDTNHSFKPLHVHHAEINTHIEIAGILFYNEATIIILNMHASMDTYTSIPVIIA